MSRRISRPRVPLADRQLQGDVLLLARSELGLTQLAVAKRARISAYWYRRMERGHQQPSLAVALAVAEALELTLDDIAPRRPKTKAAA